MLIGLDPKIIECLRFCSNKTAPGPAIFPLASGIAKETNLTIERKMRAEINALVVRKGHERLWRSPLSAYQVSVRMCFGYYER